MANRIKAAIRGRDAYQMRVPYTEVVKVSTAVTLISLILGIVVTAGFILVIGFAEAIYLPGIIIGILCATLPFIWFNWLDKIGWNTPEMTVKIKKARRHVKEQKILMKGFYKYI